MAITSVELAKSEGISDIETLNFIEAVAYLHDYFEDTIDYSKSTLKIEFEKLAKYFYTGLASAVLILSRNACTSDEEYFKNISENIITKTVKAADRISNILALPELVDNNRKKILFEKYFNQLFYFKKYKIYHELIGNSLEAVRW